MARWIRPRRPDRRHLPQRPDRDVSGLPAAARRSLRAPRSRATSSIRLVGDAIAAGGRDRGRHAVGHGIAVPERRIGPAPAGSPILVGGAVAVIADRGDGLGAAPGDHPVGLPGPGPGLLVPAGGDQPVGDHRALTPGVQHVSIDRGPLARAFGLATLQMRTAGNVGPDRPRDGARHWPSGSRPWWSTGPGRPGRRRGRIDRAVSPDRTARSGHRPRRSPAGPNPPPPPVDQPPPVAPPPPPPPAPEPSEADRVIWPPRPGSRRSPWSSSRPDSSATWAWSTSRDRGRRGGQRSPIPGRPVRRSGWWPVHRRPRSSWCWPGGGSCSPIDGGELLVARRASWPRSG